MSQQYWIYPDGQLASKQPNDGEIFSQMDSTGHKVEKWMWDGMQQRWSKLPQSNGRTWRRVGDSMEITLSPPEDLFSDPACDCGADKCGHPGHSHWCSKLNTLKP